MKLTAIMLIAFIIPATLGRSAELTAGGQEAQIEGFHHNHLPSSTSPDGLWIIKPLYHNGKFVSYEWTEAKPPVPPEPPQPPVPPKQMPAPQGFELRKGFVPKPPYDPSLFAFKPAPVSPVAPTPQCEVIYYIEPTPYAPVRFQASYRQVRGGCGILRRIFGR